jgi:CheY-like chemotaxis protein/anti-sigma regulatory factor (Ser/Thr protein kinase)
MTGTPPRVLYIDDDPGLARLVQKGLERRGFVVETLTDGAAGLSRIAKGDIDVVALDHYMPGRDGLETLAAIRERSSPPPVVYVTGTQETSVAVAALKAGASDYVLKSADGEFITLLAASLEQAMQSVRLRRAKEHAEEELARVPRPLRGVGGRARASHAGGEPPCRQFAADHRGAAAPAIVGQHERGREIRPSRRQPPGDGGRPGPPPLYTSDDVQSVALDQYLKALVDDLRSSSEHGDGNSLTLEAEPIELDPDKAVAVGVVVTELVLNATKHAYPDGKGPIRISLRSAPDGRVTLSVEDDGIGRARAETRSPQGLGRMIVKAMATKLNAEWGQDEGHPGMRVTLAFEAQSRAPGHA